MKTKMIVAVIATATIIFLSCNWFRTKEKQVSNPLIGEWKFGSVSVGKDTSLANFLLVAAMQDTNNVQISFTRDSVFTQSKDGADTVAYSFDVKTNQLATKDSAAQTFLLSKLNDSLISLTSKDSTTLYLLKR